MESKVHENKSLIGDEDHNKGNHPQKYIWMPVGGSNRYNKIFNEGTSGPFRH